MASIELIHSSFYISKFYPRCILLSQGAVGGKTGEMRIEMTFAYKSTSTGHWRIIGRTSELSKIHEQGTLKLGVGYSGKVLFVP